MKFLEFPWVITSANIPSTSQIQQLCLQLILVGSSPTPTPPPHQLLSIDSLIYTRTVYVHTAYFCLLLFYSFVFIWNIQHNSHRTHMIHVILPWPPTKFPDFLWPCQFPKFPVNRNDVSVRATKLTYSAEDDSFVHCRQRQLCVSVLGKLHKRVQVAAGLTQHTTTTHVIQVNCNSIRQVHIGPVDSTHLCFFSSQPDTRFKL